MCQPHYGLIRQPLERLLTLQAPPGDSVIGALAFSLIFHQSRRVVSTESIYWINPGRNIQLAYNYFYYITTYVNIYI